MRDLVYNGTAIHQREEMVSLTDMWKASGAEEKNRPTQWARTDTGQRFIAFITATYKLEDSQVWDTRRGRHGGGSWAHWQIALAYAQFLSPEFHAWGNTAIRERMEGRAESARQEELELAPPTFTADTITRADLRTQCEWFAKRLKAMDQHNDERLWEAIRQVVGAVWHASGSLNKRLLSPENLAEKGFVLLPAPTPDTNFITAFETCLRVIPEKVMHSRLPNKIGHVLSAHAKEHCWPQGWTAKRGLSAKRLNTYPESRVTEWLAAGGAATIEHENDLLRQEAAVEAGAIPLHQTA